MSLVEVTMYRVVCDDANCGDSPQDDGDFYAWSDSGHALDEANDCYYYVATLEDGTVVTLCPDHAPRCAEPDCGESLVNDDHGDRCDEHAPDVAPPT